MRISRDNNLNEDTQSEVIITDCHKKPIFKSDNLSEAAQFTATHLTAYDSIIRPHSSTREHLFFNYIDTIAKALDCPAYNCLSWDIKSKKLLIQSDSSNDDNYFPYSKLKKLVHPDDIEDFRITSDGFYAFDRDTRVCEKVSKAILDIIRKESKDYNI